jgi:hypothetical protein
MPTYSPGEMLVPLPWSGLPSQCDSADVDWVKSLKDTTWLSLWQRWPETNLPLGYSSYVVSFHLEAVDVDWLDRQCSRISAPIVVLFDGSYYDWPHSENLHPLCYFYWHRQCEKILKWHGIQRTIADKKYLASAVCNRITQSKMIIFTALAEYLGHEHSRLILSSWLEEKNVHYRQTSGNAELDRLCDIFWSRYYGQNIRQDEFGKHDNFQAHTSDHRQPWLSECVLHFTNESYHYSLMGDRIRPGPFITEKTLKCLVGGHAFIPVGQFETLTWLTNLGFKFDYGLDLSWDDDPGNLSRLEKICDLIKNISTMSVNDLERSVRTSTQHNLDHVNSAAFYQNCEKHNQTTIDRVLSMLQ